MSRKAVAGTVFAVILLIELIIYMSSPKPEKWDLKGMNGKQIPVETLIADNSIRKTREKVYQLEHQQTNYNNAWYIVFALTVVIGAVVVMTLPNRRE